MNRAETTSRPSLMRVATDQLSDADFRRLSDIVQSRLGIKMPVSKKVMVQSRLLRRLRLLGISSYRDYCDYLLESRSCEEEVTCFLDLMTTNKTAFLREPDHFAFLANAALPSLTRSKSLATKRHLHCWSAGCSSGEEPYSIAIVVAEYIVKENIQWSYSILGTDVSGAMLEKGRKAIYREEDISPITYDLQTKYFLRSKDRSKAVVRVTPQIRSRVTFQRINVIENDFPIRNLMNIIFCRNMLIYFDRSRQEEIISRLCEHLDPQGYFFVGHSEALHGLRVPLVAVGRSVYMRNTNE